MEPDEEEIQKTHKFSLNKQFKRWIFLFFGCCLIPISKRTKVNINVPVPSQVKEEIDSAHKTVEEDRKLAIQVCCLTRKSFWQNDRLLLCVSWRWGNVFNILIW
jgi:hypothetical protein